MNDPKTIIADFSSNDFVKVLKFPHPMQMSVMPLVAQLGEELRLLGTCFAISNHGLVLTASHVLDEGKKLLAEDRNWTLGALYIAEPGPSDDVPDLLGGLIFANRIHTSDEFDIGLMHLDLPVRVETGSPLKMPALMMGPALPNVGETCFTLGYHEMKVFDSPTNDRKKTIQKSFSASKGEIEDIHFPRRDTENLKYPCFQTSMRHDPGMSGAPVISESGAVIGVVCSAIKGQPIYYASLIGLSLFLQVDSQDDKGNAQKSFLYDFVSGGAVPVDSTMDDIEVSRTKNQLRIFFGVEPVFRGELKDELLSNVFRSLL